MKSSKLKKLTKGKRIAIITVICVCALAMIGIILWLTLNNRYYYNQAVKAEAAENFSIAAEEYSKAGDYKDAAAKYNEVAFYATDEGNFIYHLKQGLANRWKISDSLPYEYIFDNDSDSIHTLVNAELNELSAFKDKQFDDQEFTENVNNYIDGLEKQSSSIGIYASNPTQAYSDWNDGYDQRAKYMSYFVSKGLKFDDQDQQNSLNDMVNASKQLELRTKIEDDIKVTADVAEDYGTYTYTFTVVNNSNYDLSYFGLEIMLEDNDGTILEHQPTDSLNLFETGKTAQFNIYSNIRADRYEYTLNYDV